MVFAEEIWLIKVYAQEKVPKMVAFCYNGNCVNYSTVPAESRGFTRLCILGAQRPKPPFVKGRFGGNVDIS